MTIIRKSATISNTDEEFPGSFRVVLSAPTLDRDGDTLLPEEWKTPLPDHITFDIDHGMSVATTVGSGTPYLNDAGQVPEAPEGAIIVDGKYWSGDLGQSTRSKVGEGHIKTTSVAFMTEKSQQKDGSTVLKRELLNGAFVAIPSNREALVLNSKGLKAGARNSASDAEHIQAIHDHATALGATHDAEDADSKSFSRRAERAAVKSVAGSLEATQDRARDALQDAYPGFWVYLQATIPEGDGGVLVFQLENTDTYDTDSFKQSYTDDGSVITLTGERSAVDLMQVIKPDPDEDAADSGATDAPASGAEKSAPVAGTKVAPVEDADSDAVTAENLETLALQIQAAQFI